MITKNFEDFVGKTFGEFIGEFKNLSALDAKNFLLKHSALFKFLQEKKPRSFIISDHEDFLLEHKRAPANIHKDYLDEFIKFIQDNQNEIAADIISIIRRFALGAPLLNHDDKIKNAVNKLKAEHNFSANELKWLSRIEKYLLNH